MICPYCPFLKPGKNNEYEMSDLLDHVLTVHPKDAIAAARVLLKGQAIELTDVEFTGPEHGT